MIEPETSDYRKSHYCLIVHWRYARCWWHLTLHMINVERTFHVFFFIFFFFIICVCITWAWLGWGCFDVLFFIFDFHFLFLLIFILFSLSSGGGSFFSLTRVLTVGKYADTTFVLFFGDFGKLLINLETALCFIVLFFRETVS